MTKRAKSELSRQLKIEKRVAAAMESANALTEATTRQREKPPIKTETTETTAAPETRTATGTIDDQRMYEAISLAWQFHAYAPRLLELLESMAGPGAREYLAGIRQEEPVLF